ncbi:hypothetical protein Tco_0746924 [Tanacetum coccineum]
MISFGLLVEFFELWRPCSPLGTAVEWLMSKCFAVLSLLRLNLMLPRKFKRVHVSSVVADSDGHSSIITCYGRNTVVTSRTAGESSVAGTTGVVTIVGVTCDRHWAYRPFAKQRWKFLLQRSYQDVVMHLTVCCGSMFGSHDE